MNIELVKAMAEAAQRNEIPDEYLIGKQVKSLDEINELVKEYKKYRDSQTPPSDKDMDSIMANFLRQ